MRKILLGTTAVVGAALLAPAGASAQEAPTVRIGGYFQAFYGHTTQSNPNGNNIAFADPANITAGAFPVGSPTLGTTGVVQNQTPVTSLGSVRTGKNDFFSDAEVHVFVNGKAANGMSYGAVMELAFDLSEGSAPAGGRRTYTAKTMAWIDEMYAFVSTPTLGQIRFGDEDGPVGGLMNAGVITNFGTGGVYGFWQNAVIRPNRTTTSPGDLGDNTKIIYLSPQFFGFDAGVSFALNSGTGQDNGCVQSFATWSCDRTYAFTGATANAIQSFTDQPQRRNETQWMVRWRGDLMGIGLAASFGGVTWASIRDQTVAGNVATTLRPGQVWQAGIQASAYGFTLGAQYQWGQHNFFWGSQVRGDQDAQQFFAGGSYTLGPISVGANSYWGSFSGTSGLTFNTTTGALTRTCTAANPTCAAQRRYGYSVGANYRLAPGLDLIAEYVRHVIHEPGVNVAGAASGSNQDKLRADVILVGTRLAF
ncbi:MAG TPA: porin [Crenalkalicoccus sp.]|jgi:hypothetical protein|nr:porin [Crenalkalicoccus sp.]